MASCPHCYAPYGKMHATFCPQRITESGNVKENANVEIGYYDSKNKRSFADGMEFQDFVGSEFNKWGFYIQLHASRFYQFSKGESVQRVEIKLDDGCVKYNHLSIEVQERKNNMGSWVNSGIYRNDDTVFYVQGNTEVLYMFLRRDLVKWHKEKEGGAYTEPLSTIRRFFLEFPDADELCIVKLCPLDKQSSQM